MATNDRDHPEHWRERAEEARTKAEQMRDAVSQATLRGIADSYDMLAARAECAKKATR
jgi:hypothetical protein